MKIIDKFHTPVMPDAILNFMNLCPGKVVVDATIGTAGHSRMIFERILPGGRLIGIDRDAESLEIAKERLSDFRKDADFVQGNFTDIDVILKRLDIKNVDGILFDLGISSFQLENAERGFSFQSEGPLDMRLDRASSVSAYDLINNLNEDELSSLLWNFGQERWHNRIAHRLVQQRERQPISTTLELAHIVAESVPFRYRYAYHRIHPATRTFQAVRIAVNRELDILEQALDKSIGLLRKKGRLCVISFHSLEDRIVKFTFRRAHSQEKIKIITPKPLVPDRQEAMANPSSRSAKLRVAERI